MESARVGLRHARVAHHAMLDTAIATTEGRKCGQLFSVEREGGDAHRRSDARIVENGFATSGGLSKSAKVVLGRALIKIAIGDSDLINVRFGSLCGRKSDIARSPRSARC